MVWLVGGPRMCWRVPGHGLFGALGSLGSHECANKIINQANRILTPCAHATRRRRRLLCVMRSRGLRLWQTHNSAQRQITMTSALWSVLEISVALRARRPCLRGNKFGKFSEKTTAWNQTVHLIIVRFLISQRENFWFLQKSKSILKMYNKFSPFLGTYEPTLHCVYAIRNV